MARCYVDSPLMYYQPMQHLRLVIAAVLCVALLPTCGAEECSRGPRLNTTGQHESYECCQDGNGPPCYFGWYTGELIDGGENGERINCHVWDVGGQCETWCDVGLEPCLNYEFEGTACNVDSICEPYTGPP